MSTSVDGSVNGMSLTNVSAVSLTDTALLVRQRNTVWFASGLRCSQLDLAGGLRLQPSRVTTRDGGHQALVVSSTQALFDLPDGRGRVMGWTDSFTVTAVDDDGTLRGRFAASFDGGGFVGGFTGEFVAPPCPSAEAGCSSAPGLMTVAALLVLGLRRRSR